VHLPDRPVPGEPALAFGLVYPLPPIPALRPGDPLEDGRADPGTQPVGAAGTFHPSIISAAEIRLAAATWDPKLTAHT